MKFPSSNYSYGAHETLESLYCPPVDFWPVYSYGVRGIVTREEFAKSLDTLAARGIRGLYMLPYTNAFSSYHVDEHEYMSEGFIDMMRAFVEEAEKRGINLWMYDEAGWPSGSANGFVVRDNPELMAYALDKNKNKIAITPMAQPYPDLMNARSTEVFMKYTHEKYREAFGDYGAHFKMTFTDEPFVGSIDDPNIIFWSDCFEESFRSVFGYDVMDHFEHLFSDGECDELTRRVRADYHDLASRLFVDNYFIPLRDFCRENGSLATGHLQGDDAAFASAKWGFHHLLRCLRAMDVPAIDVIWRQIFPGPHMPPAEPFAPLCANVFFPRYASSAAHQTGARLALTESFGVYGAGITYSERRWVYNFQLVRGINLLNPMTLRHSYKGRQYAGSCAAFADIAPGKDDLYGFNLWAARASYLMSCGEPVADAALYIPMYDIWAGDKRARDIAEGFEALGAQLEARGCDIDIIDDDTILAASISDGALKIGNASYKTVYIHKDSTISDVVSEKLAQLTACGGTVTVCTDGYTVSPIIESNCDKVRATRRKIDDGTVYYLTSEAFSDSDARVRFPLESAGVAYELDLIDLSRRVVSVAPYEAVFELGRERVLLFPNKTIDATPENKEIREHSITLSDFEIYKKREVMLTADGLEEKIIDKDVPTPIELGDWRECVGEYFSGDCVYRTTFRADKEMSYGATLELGEVRYTCEVFLNGESLGTKIFAPFRYELTNLREDNELVIRVSNTLANAYKNARYEEWFPDWKPNKLYNLSTEFERDSLPSGLFGPVVLKY